MSTTPPLASLVSRHTDATCRLILASALALLERSDANEVTARAIAKQAGMSERTIFRYFASRDQLLDAVALAAYRSFETPPPPRTLPQLCRYPRNLYSCFEQKAALVRASLHSEISGRIRSGVGRERWRAVRALVDAGAPRRSDRDRRIAAANINYYLTATAWHYYRFFFGLSLEDTIDAAQSAVRLAIRALIRREPVDSHAVRPATPKRPSTPRRPAPGA